MPLNFQRMSELLKGIEVVIFDFGEVLIELDYPRVVEGFSKAASRNKEAIEELIVTSPILQDFECGRLTPGEFRAGVNQLLGCSLSDDTFDEIWNSMLKNLPKSRMDILQKVSQRFDTYLLSNSNVIHEEAFNKMIVEVTGKRSMHELMKKAYFSQDIGLRKPYLECFEYVAAEIGTKPEHILFLDDRLDNIQGAQEAGWRTVQIVNADKQLREIFESE